LLIGGLYTAAYCRAGLSYSPDSSFYMLYAARLNHWLDYSAGAAMYAPFFPVTIAAAMVFVDYPGEGAMCVLGVSACATMVAAYTSIRLCQASRAVALGGVPGSS
jgi:hypothetical protein